MIAYGTPIERRSARFYLDQLRDLAPKYGYGFVGDRVKPRPAIAAAAYIGKYLTKDSGPTSLRALVLEGNAPERPVNVHRRLTMRTRVTMRNLRLRRAGWMRWGVRMSCAEIETIWRICETFPGTELIREPAPEPDAFP